MKKINRVTSSEDFAKIVHLGKVKKSKQFVIHFLHNNIGFSRVGISVSKKIGIAVLRNKIKRQVRAMIDEIIDFDKNSIDFIIVVKDSFLTEDFHTNKKKMESLITSIHGEN